MNSTSPPNSFDATDPTLPHLEHRYNPDPLWFLLNGYLSAVLTLSINIILIALIKYKTPASLKSYSIILLAHSISDLLYEGVRFCTNVRSIPLNGEFYFLVGGYVTPRTDADAQYQCILYFWLSVLVPIGMMTIDFVCRYVIICRNKEFNGKHVAAFVCVVYTVSFIYVHLVNLPGKECLRAGPSLTKQEVAYLHATYDYGSRRAWFAVADMQDIQVKLMLAVANAVIFCDYVTIGFVTHRIYNKIKFEMNNDLRAQRLNIQVLRVMIMQAAAPSILLVPLSVTISYALFYADKPSLYLSCVSLIIAWVRPLATILLISPYRRVFIQRDLFGGRKDVTMTFVSQGHESVSQGTRG